MKVTKSKILYQYHKLCHWIFTHTT